MTTSYEEARARLVDSFDGDNAHLVRSIEALIALSDNGGLVPHGIGGLARSLLSAAAVRLSGPPEPTEEEVARVMADRMGWPFDDQHIDKSDWVATGGWKGGIAKDVNGPFQCEYLEAARAIQQLYRGSPHPSPSPRSIRRRAPKRICSICAFSSCAMRENC